jgi:outer membrane protein TolC
MKPALRSISVLLLVLFLLLIPKVLNAEPLTLKHAVELALAHSTTTGAAAADEQRALASYEEARNQYVPQLVVGSGLGASWGFPLSLEGSAPSILNVNAQSALFNPALREFVRAARTEWKASEIQSKDQRAQAIQDTVLAYMELNKWESLMGRLGEEQAEAAKMEESVNQRVQAGIDSAQSQTQARLASARVRYRMAEAQGAIAILQNRLAHLTGLPAASIGTVGDSIPALPETQKDNGAALEAAGSSPAFQIAQTHADAQALRAKGEHRALWPQVDFAAQYALLAEYNNYSDFYKSFQRHNATVGVSIRFPFFSASQRARARAADAAAVKASKDAEAAKNKVSEETLKLQNSVEQLSAAQEVASLEYQVAQSNLDAVKVRTDSGTATLHALDDARNQASERFHALQSAEFELQRARVGLLRATGGLEDWVGVSK